MALGVIPPLCASLSPVLAGPQGCSRGRWRSGPSKWRHTATLGGRGQGAPRTCRCIETVKKTHRLRRFFVREHHAPVGALRHMPMWRRRTPTTSQGAPRTCRCIETIPLVPSGSEPGVREHHAPVGALRPGCSPQFPGRLGRQGAPRTCRCIETMGPRRKMQPPCWVREHHAPVGALRSRLY